MQDRPQPDHTDVLMQTRAALSRGRADLARMKICIEQSAFQVDASRTALMTPVT